MAPRKRLGQLLTELGVIDDHQLQSALGHQRQWGGKIGGILVQKGFCGEEQLVSALAQHLNMERVKLSEAKVDARAVKYVSRQIAEKLHVFPYEVSGAGRSEVISIAMSDPTDLSAVDQLAFHTGKRIKPILAADSEIVAAIQSHYGPGEEKKEPTDKVARPGAPAAAAPGFPRRIEPQATAPAAHPPRPAAPAPAPAAHAAPAAAAAKPSAPAAPKPEAAAAPPATAPAPGAPVPVDLPEDEGDMGLEPIAAHSQFGDAVSGKEEVAGDGSAGDSIEGLVSASLAYQGAEDAAAVAAPEAAWPEAEGSRTGQDPGWGTPVQETGEGWATPPNEPAAAWSSEPAAQPSSGGWSMEEPATSAGWSAPDDAQAWDVTRATPPEEAPSEVLPTDAILGALEPSPDQEGRGQDSDWGAEEEAEGAQAAPSPEASAGPPPESPAAQEESPPEEPGSFESAASEPASEPPAMESSGSAAAEAGGPAALDLEAEASEAPAPAPMELDAGPQQAAQADFDAAAMEVAEAAAQDALADHGPDTEPIPPPSFEASPEHEAEAPDAWAASDDPLAAEGGAGHSEVEAGAPAQELSDPLREEGANAPGLESAPDEEGESLEVDTGSFEMAEEAPAAPPAEAGPAGATPEPPEPGAPSRRWEQNAFEPGRGGEGPPPAESTERFAAQGEIGSPAWTGSGPAAEPEHPAWMGEALEGSTPLSPADLGTLASIGVRPSDGVGALRLLAALVRLLNRSQLIEPDDLRAEIRESCAAGAAAAAEATNGMESEGSAPGADDPSSSRAET